jgi:protein-S-isoprenylcysteine O-methyltransferase Ste14
VDEPRPQGDAPAPRRRILRSPFRRKNFRPRVLAPVAAAAVGLAFSAPTTLSLCVGLALAASGEALRLWATGHLVKTDRLTVAGPYAHLRHPLYAGTLLIGAGLLVAAGRRVAAFGLPLGLGVFFLYYLPYKERVESARLETRHGTAFTLYRSQVPLLLPRLRPFVAGPEREGWSFSHVLENDELGTALAVVIAFTVLTLVAVALR